MKRVTILLGLLLFCQILFSQTTFSDMVPVNRYHLTELILRDSFNRGYIPRLLALIQADSAVIVKAKNLAATETLRADTAWAAKLKGDSINRLYVAAEKKLRRKIVWANVRGYVFAAAAAGLVYLLK